MREEENRGWVLYCCLEGGAAFIDLGTCVKENEPSSFCFLCLRPSRYPRGKGK